MSFIIPLLYFIFTTALIVYISKNTFGKCIPITIFLTSFVYFFSQVIFKTFKVGLIINLLFPILFFVIILIKRKNKEEIKQFKSNFLSNGFYAFITIFVLIFIFDYNRHFSMWDEFSHWGVMVKEMIRTDNFYSSKLSTLMVHKDYPPIIQLFELFYSTISGGYSEAYVIRAVHLLEFCLLIPFIESINKNKNKKNVMLKTFLITFIMFLTILFFDQHNVINSIYVDYSMAIIVAYIISIIIFENNLLSNFNLINLGLGISFLLLTKQIALVFYLMILFFYVINCFIKRKYLNNYKNILSIIKVIFILLIVPLSIWKGWNMYVENLNVEQQFKFSDIKLSKIKGIIYDGEGESWQYHAAHNYIDTIQTGNMTSSKEFKLSYFQCMILTMILIYFVYCYGKELFTKKQCSLLQITLFIGYIGYAFVMLVMYMFSFGDVEGPNLASFDRYMPTYIILCLVLIIMIFTYIHSYYNNSVKNLIIILAVLILIQTPNEFKKCMPKISGNYNMVYEEHANKIKSKIKENSKVFIVAQNTFGDYQFYVKYYLGTATTNLHYFTLPVDIEDAESYYNENVKEYMNTFDYIYIASITDEYKKLYGFIYDNDIEAGQLYRNENNKFILID